MSSSGVISGTSVRTASVLPWWREVTRDQWRAFFAVFLGWIVDSFDFNILAFILIDIQKHFTVDKALAGALGTVTLMMRLIGGTIAGAAADRWGRKLPLMLSVLWFSIFAFLSGFSTSYAMLFGLRALFGLGMGGEWAAGMPLVLEHWPTKLRGLASGLMLGGWYWGYLLSAAVFQFVYPMFDDAVRSSRGARCSGSASSRRCSRCGSAGTYRRVPVWLARQRAIAEAKRVGRPLPDSPGSVARIFKPDLLWTTVQTTLVIGSFMCIYYSVNFWYPTFLREGQRETLPYLALFNIGAIVGTAVWGTAVRDATGPPRRGHDDRHPRPGVAAVFLYSDRHHDAHGRRGDDGRVRHGRLGHGPGLYGGALSRRRRAVSARGSATTPVQRSGATMPTLLGFLQDRGFAMVNAMSAAMVVSALVALVAIWSGPETRGKVFD